MKTFLFFCTTALFIFSGNCVFAASSPGEVKSTPSIALKDSNKFVAFFLQLKPGEIERLTSHKLTLKEKIAVKIYKLRLRIKGDEGDLAKKEKLGTLSLIFGIAAFVLVVIHVPVIGILSIPLAVAAVVLGAISLKGNKNTRGIIGLILGGTFILLFIIAVLIVIAFLGSF